MKHDTIFFDEDEANIDGFETVVMKDWSSFGIMLNSSNTMKTIEEVGDMMFALMDDGYVEKWFFLYEGSFVAVRFLRSSPSGIPMEKEFIKEQVVSTIEAVNLIYQTNSFSTYKEKKGKLFNKDTVEVFAEIMCATTALWMAKRTFETNFSNYRFMERVGHCMFNVLCGGFVHSVKDERYFLHQRVMERGRLVYDDEFEDFAMPNIKLKKYLEVPPVRPRPKKRFPLAVPILFFVAGLACMYMLLNLLPAANYSF